MTTREEENLPSDEDRENLEDTPSDDCVIVILEEGDIPAQVSEETTAAQEVGITFNSRLKMSKS